MQKDLEADIIRHLRPMPLTQAHARVLCENLWKFSGLPACIPVCDSSVSGKTVQAGGD